MRRAPHRVGGLRLGRVAAEGETKIEIVLDGDTVKVREASLAGQAA
jgi:hypothetical protein